MAVLACLQHDPRASARLIEALGEEHVILACPGWDRLRDLLGSHRVDGCILDLERSGRDDALRPLEEIRLGHPGLAVVVYTDFHGRELDLFLLGRLGVDGVVLAGREDDSSLIRQVVDRALASALAGWVVARLGGRLDPVGVAALRWAVEHARDTPDVARFSEAVGMSPRVLNVRLRSAGLPSAGRILLWGRLLRCAGMMRGRAATLETVAYRLGYSSASALRRAMRQQARLTPSEFSTSLGVEYVVEAFLECLPPSRPILRRVGGPRPVAEVLSRGLE